MRTKLCKTCRRLAALLVVCGGASLAVAQPVKLAEFQFNEGSGSVTRSTINDLTGTLGLAANPDNVPQVITDSPSGAANDRAVQLMGTGYLLVDDRTDPLLALATEPFTVETWVRWDGMDFDQYNGLMAYGGAYKLGLNSGQIIWTLFGVVDIESGHILPSDNLWHHVAAVYEPGVGVTIYLDGVPSFIP
jgi:hypothetical protein